MRISHRFQFIFLAYPRTASSSIRRILDSYSDVEGVHLEEVTVSNPFHHHMNAQEACSNFNNLGWDWSAYESFCLVRNPYHRLASLFWRRTEARHLRDARLNKLSLGYSNLLAVLPPKAGFLMYVLTRRTNTGVSQSLEAFTQDLNGHSLVSTILKFENLDVELPQFLESIGITISSDEIPHLNARQEQIAFAELYLPLTAAIIKKKYQTTIREYGYEVVF